jgi:hypothetical protein
MARIVDLIEEHCGRPQFVILSCHPESYALLHGAARRELAYGQILAME